MSEATPKKDRGKPKPKVEQERPASWYNLAELAWQLGFDTLEIRRLRNQNPDVKSAQEFLRSLRDPERFEIDSEALPGAVTDIAAMVERIFRPRTVVATPEFTTDSQEQPRMRRCGRPFDGGYREDRKFLLFGIMYTPFQPTRKRHLTSLAMKRDVFLSFFGSHTFRLITSETSAPAGGPRPWPLAPHDGRQGDGDTGSHGEPSTGQQPSHLGGQASGPRGSGRPHGKPSDNDVGASGSDVGDDGLRAPGFEGAIQEMKIWKSLEEDVDDFEAILAFVANGDDKPVVFYNPQTRQYYKFPPRPTTADLTVLNRMVSYVISQNRSLLVLDDYKMKSVHPKKIRDLITDYRLFLVFEKKPLDRRDPAVGGESLEELFGETLRERIKMQRVPGSFPT